MRALEYIDARLIICFIQCLISNNVIVNEGEVRKDVWSKEVDELDAIGEMNNWVESAKSSREGDEVGRVFEK